MQRPGDGEPGTGKSTRHCAGRTIHSLPTHASSIRPQQIVFRDSYVTFKRRHVGYYLLQTECSFLKLVSILK